MRRKQSANGSAIVGVMVLALIASGTMFALMGYASHSLQLTRRSLEFQKAQAAAEAGLDYGVIQLLEALRTNRFTLSQADLQTVLDGLPGPPSFGSYAYTSPSGSNSFRISVDTVAQTGAIPQGYVASGMEGTHQNFTITCGARNPGSDVGAVVEEQVQAISVFLNRYGMFYQDDLEVDPGSLMNFVGPVHGNSDVYLDGPIDFHDRVTAQGNIFHRRKDDGTTGGNVYIENGAAQMVSMTQALLPMDSDHADWMTESLTLWDGRVLDRAHGVPNLSLPYNPLSDAHDLIEHTFPTNHPDYQADTEAIKFVNNAALIIHVNATGTFTATDFLGTDVTSNFSPATLKDEGDYLGVPMQKKKADKRYEMLTAGSYETTRTFYDAREAATVAVLDLYMEVLLSEFPDLYNGTYTSSQGNRILYVTRDDPDGAGGLMPAIRLRNAREMPTGGLTIVSDLPVYIEGEYNIRNGVKPALVAGDAVTLLSRNWQDARSTAATSVRDALGTQYNLVVMTGNQPTTPGVYNGGAENIFRHLEDWSGYTLTFRGSIIDLWYSEVATGLWNSSHYNSPTRDYSHDVLNQTAIPPGAFEAFAVEQLSWNGSTWAAEGW